MILAKLKARLQESGKPMLCGQARVSIKSGTHLMLKRNGDNYELWFVDKRKINRKADHEVF